MQVRSEIKMLFPLAFVLPLIILIEGFVSIAIEILTIRQLLPVAGGSVIVTSIIIGIFLLFLALGYQRGGNIYDHPQSILRRNFLITALWLGLGLSYLFISVFFQVIEKKTGNHIIYPLVAYLLLIIAPLIYLLGQTIPIIMNMLKQNHLAGKMGGSALALSTIGSFFGALFTTLILMYYLGVAWTVFINFILLIFLSLLLSEKMESFLTTLLIAAASALIIYSANVSFENQAFVASNNYANYQVLDHTNSNFLRKDERIFMINNAASSYTNFQGRAFPYVEMIKRLLFHDFGLHDAEILVLGAGGFTLSAENVFNNHFTYVDIDSQINKIVDQHFMPASQNHLIADDARHYLKSTNKQYQAIIVDVYSDIKAIPSHLITREYMAAILPRLAPQGIVIFNVIANPMLSDPYSKRIDNTIRAVFKNCMIVPETYTNQITNIIYACNKAANDHDGQVYSDNLNNSTTDSFYW